jgi:two-component system nitrate/nitrite response regulator NarL
MGEQVAICRPQLSIQETRVLLGYVSGLKLETAARRAGVRPCTAKQYLDRVRRKYSEVGRPARTKLELATRAREDGLLIG